jgi:hypothetical protein
VVCPSSQLSNCERDYELAATNVANGVNYALAAKNALGGGQASSPAPPPAASPPAASVVPSSPSVAPSVAAPAPAYSPSVAPSVVPPYVAPSVVSVAPAATAPNVGVPSVPANNQPSVPVAGVPSQSIQGATTLQTVHHHSKVGGVPTVQPGLGKGRSTYISALTITDPSRSTAASVAAAATPPADLSSTSCSAEGAMTCIGGQVAECVSQQYVLTSCGPGTTCVEIPIDGNETVVT